MNQGRGLQGLARLLVRKFGGGELAEFVINEWQQLLRGARIARLNVREDLSDVAHVCGPCVDAFPPHAIMAAEKRDSCPLEAHQLQVLLSPGNPEATQAAPVWRPACAKA